MRSRRSARAFRKLPLQPRLRFMNEQIGAHIATAGSGVRYVFASALMCANRAKDPLWQNVRTRDTGSDLMPETRPSAMIGTVPYPCPSRGRAGVHTP